MLLNFTPKNLKGTVTDYSKLYAVKQKGITEQVKPDYIPVLDCLFFRNNGCRVPFVKLAVNEYLLFGNREAAFIVDLDILARTQDFYLKLMKESHRLAIEEQKAAAVAKYGENVYFKMRRLTTYGENKMSRFQFDLYKRNGLSGADSWTEYRRDCNELNQKLSDLELETLESNDSFSKGETTSYGDTNLSDALLDRYGVRVKRQNGDRINAEEIDELKTVLDEVFACFGDLSPVCREYGLKISHSAEKRMHGRKFVGFFSPYFKAIGVGYAEMSQTLAHELAHFMDCYKAQRSSVKRWHASDEDGSIENEIARLFRRGMRKPQASDYQRRTCECFARALEQYFNPAVTAENFCKDEIFEQGVKPLIEEFLADFAEIVAEIRMDEKPVELPQELKAAASIAAPLHRERPEPIRNPEQLNLF
jgi:hypothetical protein